MNPLTLEELTGQTRSHVQQVEGFALHPLALQALTSLQEAAAKQGFQLAVFSAFRDFNAQCRIWNLKWRGDRPLYDAHAQPLDPTQLTDFERMRAILAWSALPGTSRHHWGSEIDLFDNSALAPGWRVELLPWEYATGGPFFPLTEWLAKEAANYGFFRPYRVFQGGVQPEPWHYSYAPVSEPALRQLNKKGVWQALQTAPLEAKELIFERLDWILKTYSQTITKPERSTLPNL